jgi:hypothetical protein
MQSRCLRFSRKTPLKLVDFSQLAAYFSAHSAAVLSDLCDLKTLCFRSLINSLKRRDRGEQPQSAQRKHVAGNLEVFLKLRLCPKNFEYLPFRVGGTKRDNVTFVANRPIIP